MKYQSIIQLNKEEYLHKKKGRFNKSLYLMYLQKNKLGLHLGIAGIPAKAIKLI